MRKLFPFNQICPVIPTVIINLKDFYYTLDQHDACGCGDWSDTMTTPEKMAIVQDRITATVSLTVSL